MSVVDDIEKLADSVKSGMSGSLGEIAAVYKILPKEVSGSVSPIANGVGHFAGSLEGVLKREMGQLNKGLDTDRYQAVMDQVDNGAHTAALDLVGKLKPFDDVAKTVHANIDHFDLSNAVSGLTNATYAGDLKSLLQQVHNEYQQLAANKGLDPLPQLGIAFNAATQMLDAMPVYLLSVLEKMLPTASLQSLLAHLQAAGNEDKSVGLRAVHAESGADNSTGDYLKTGAAVSDYLGNSCAKLGDILTKELSFKVAGKVNVFIGAVAGWAAAIGAKLGIDVKVTQGFSLRTVTIDAAAPFFTPISVFFALLGIAMNAAADWLEVDQAPS